MLISGYHYPPVDMESCAMQVVHQEVKEVEIPSQQDISNKRGKKPPTAHNIRLCPYSSDNEMITTIDKNNCNYAEAFAPPVLVENIPSANVKCSQDAFVAHATGVGSSKESNNSGDYTDDAVSTIKVQHHVFWHELSSIVKIMVRIRFTQIICKFSIISGSVQL